MLLEDNTGFCPWCHQGTAFVLVHQVTYATPKFGGQSTYRVDLADKYRTGVLIFECRHCGKAVVLLEHEYPGNPDLSIGGKVWRSMVSPSQSPRTMHESVPESVRGLFEEASRCEQAGAMRGAAVLYRATVEELLKCLGLSGRLQVAIDGLKGRVDDLVIQDLHEARALGNDSIHSGIVFSADEVADVASLIEETVLALFVQPEEKRQMREARRTRRNAAKQRGRLEPLDVAKPDGPVDDPAPSS